MIHLFSIHILILYADQKSASCSRPFCNKKLLRTLVLRSYVLNGESGIWTRAPRERSTPLAGAPLQPLEYFSMPESLYQYVVMNSMSLILSQTQNLLYKEPISLSITLFKRFWYFAHRDCFLQNRLLQLQEISLL